MQVKATIKARAHEASYLWEMERVKSIRRHLWESLMIFLLGIPAALIYCESCRADWLGQWFYFVFSGVMWMVLWKGNEFMAELADRKVSWVDKPAIRLSLGLAGHVVFSVFAASFINLVANLLIRGKFPFTLETFLQYSVPAVMITLTISLFLTARKFLISWRNLAVQHEKLKTQAMASRFATLKNQINPHFLFNSLNVLTNLVYKDPDQSAKFIRNLADIYRYVLDTQDRETVDLEEELEFVKAFIYLQKIRFGEHLQVNIDLPQGLKVIVPPMTLQMLLENAIKHNVISKEHPLKIDISSEDGYITVMNNLFKKEILTEKKNSLGLENIKARYKFLTGREVVVNHDLTHFTVKLPALDSS
jgi:sensor histidine kinase YesM